MRLNKFVGLLIATLEPPDAHVVIRLPDGQNALVYGVTSKNGDVVIFTTLDSREELQ